MGGATGLKCNFFSSNLQWSPWRKKRDLSPPNGRQGPVAPPTGDRGLSPVGGTTGPLALAAICRHSLCHLSLKIQEKRGVRRRKTAKLCRIAYFLKWWKGTAIGSRMSGQRMPHLGNPWSPCWAVATCDLVLAARYTMVPILSYSSVLSDMWGLRMLFSILVSWKCVLFSSRPRCIS